MPGLNPRGSTASFADYTRMVPAHFVTEILLIGCPDPDPTYTRFLVRSAMR